jgi:hypothetical protein
MSSTMALEHVNTMDEAIQKDREDRHKYGPFFIPAPRQEIIPTSYDLDQQK